ncbi:MAG: alpha amylase C-terminal domain-containing protein [Bacteroidaceae bacterium]|nr:alpha amylase C-terminal domain-containing protein [Bacteroidaceae bacterium]
MLNLIARDSYLEPYTLEIDGRYRYFLQREKELTKNGRQTLSDFASGYLYFGLHRTSTGWCFREWAPNAKKIVLIGDFSNWEERPEYELKALPGGVWERRMPRKALQHGQHYKMKVYWDGGCGERIPAWTRRVVQDDATKIFSAQVWCPEEEYKFKHTKFTPKTSPLLIYECHIGMAQEEEKVGTYKEFQEKILPRVAADGYNCIQIMAIQEHPYYGSFGYHVSNFFAPSSRFGTPEELKELIDTAHGMGLAVIMDLVHSHAVRNELEGLGMLDGDPAQYFHAGERRIHSAWDSLCFDYGKNQVVHFLLSNCKYWLEEYKFDGFRFDGVTSMIYYSHGLGEAFCSYVDYFNGHQDGDAICYLTLANRLIHTVNPKAITIAEEVSGMPGLAAPIEDGGYGFDYRMAMNVPDYWIKVIKECRDEDWKPSSIFWELTNRRKDEKTISYAESHDQALVGDKTIIFRLIDADMYWHFKRGDETGTVTRGIALHKMIRLITLATINGGYLNFMGNEFGHPEWIDFPREGNGWSHKYARRQWSLVDNPDYFYTVLGEFDKEMTKIIGGAKNFQERPVKEIWHNDGDQVLAFSRRDLIFVFNFNPTRSFTDYGLLVPEGDYSILMSSDNERFGGYGLVDESQTHFTQYDKLHARRKKGWLQLYLPARTALVLKKNRKSNK